MKQLIKKVMSLIYPGELIIQRVNVQDSKVALTFDDGPHPVNTPKLLAVLERESIKATFFCSGAECEKYPGLIKEVSNRGHEIGNHSFRHKKLKEVGAKEYQEDILRTNEIIHKNIGIVPKLFRSPYGELNLGILRIVRGNKMLYTGWTIDSNDSYIKGKGQLIQYLSKQDIRKGDILLFHEDYEHTIEAMPEIIGLLREKGFGFETVSGLKDLK